MWAILIVTFNQLQTKLQFLSSKTHNRCIINFDWTKYTGLSSIAKNTTPQTLTDSALFKGVYLLVFLTKDGECEHQMGGDTRGVFKHSTGRHNQTLRAL